MLQSHIHVSDWLSQVIILLGAVLLVVAGL